MDLFEREQGIYEDSFMHVIDVRSGAPVDFEIFESLTEEYGRLLKHARRVTKMSDKNTVDLFARNIDLTNKVHYDSLTGIYNRRFMEECIKRNIKELSRSNSVISVLMMDVDFFKKYNDTYGHTAGDICLQAIAETLSKCITREDDFVARYGGEEFIIVLPNTDENGACIMAAKVNEKMIERNIPHEKSEVAGYITISIGITSARVKHTHQGADYIKCADDALYISKQAGRNRYTFLQYEGEKSEV